MKEKALLSTKTEVRAILDGRQTQLRRLMTPQPALYRVGAGEYERDVVLWPGRHPPATQTSDRAEWVMGCRLGAPGDRLWVRETWQTFDPETDGIDPARFGPAAPYHGVDNGRPIKWRAVYAADGSLVHPVHGKANWKPSTHMPRWAARLVLEIVAVRIERLQTITDADIAAAGVRRNDGGPKPLWFGWHSLWTTPREAFADRWNHTTGKAAPWASNPWTWVVDVKRVEVPS